MWLYRKSSHLGHNPPSLPLIVVPFKYEFDMLRCIINICYLVGRGSAGATNRWKAARSAQLAGGVLLECLYGVVAEVSGYQGPVSIISMYVTMERPPLLRFHAHSGRLIHDCKPQWHGGFFSDSYCSLKISWNVLGGTRSWRLCNVRTTSFTFSSLTWILPLWAAMGWVRDWKHYRAGQGHGWSQFLCLLLHACFSHGQPSSTCTLHPLNNAHV